ncbi:nitroreductase [Paraneptunicella aestuarii]|uniref:nitroreductase family protein n=1 Tax=Paraneptunicella aestuarii TaxID=2831148 RepID=UPI001E4BB846|nr:nitroreductase [Paraneptunicella aestuarii]UAA37369.1 nitroreductase [Paraneptunicella aestuarii]
MTELLNFLTERVSYHVHELTQPAPDQAQLQQILRAAMATPDHGNLTPWHFVIIDNERIAEFVEYLRQAWLDSEEEVDPQQAKRLANYLEQAPCMVLVSAEIQAHQAVSEQDQLFSAVASCQNILLAADAIGFGGIWYSTDAVELPNVRHILGLQAHHQPVGFLVLGTPENKRSKKRKSPEQFTYQWLGSNQLAPWSEASTSTSFNNLQSIEKTS